MPTIDPTLIPCIDPGSLFSRLTADPTLNVRWFVAVDPVTHSVLNRPIADIAVRQLILAKTLDAVSLRLGHQSMFPFLVTAQVSNGTQNVDIPPSWIWDMQVSLPQKWEKVRLARVKRLSGMNGASGGEYTGLIRLVFTAQSQGSTTEISVFQADFRIDSDLTYQIARVSIPLVGSEPAVLPAGETETVGGFVTFRTLNAEDAGVQAFYNVVAPPVDTTTDSAGLFITPNVIEINDSLPGGSGISNDFDFLAVAHGTGLLTLSAYNPIPSVDSTVSTWINTFNYPFEEVATLQDSSGHGIIIPTGLFKEFNLVAPAGDEPTGDVSGNFRPVWISRIVRDDAASNSVTLYFSTFNIEAPSIVPVEFAVLVLTRTATAGTRLAILPGDNLFPTQVSTDWNQGFGKGHVVLSDLWQTNPTAITDFFDRFLSIIDIPPQAIFTKESTRLSSYGLSRVPDLTPTVGQAAALRGTRQETNEHPNSTNRYIVELDQGLGAQVDFANEASLPLDRRENPDIERFGWKGALAHRVIRMCVNTDGGNHEYDTDILPRLRILLGRDPAFGDFWWDGVTLKFFNGDAWIT